MTRTFSPPLRIAIAAAFLLTVAFVTQQSTAFAATTTVGVGDFFFCDATFENGVCETTISAGDTVVWDFDGATQPHTTTECGADCDAPTDTPLWDSWLIVDGSTFQYTFDEPGIYLYCCQVHPFLQRGTIIVQGEGDAGDLGDVNCGGTVDAIDAALVLQLGAGLLGSLACKDNADANEDGTINSIDAALILQFTAGLLPSLPP